MVKRITADELSYLLYKVTIATRRNFSDDEGSLWLDLLSGESYDACYEAFNEYLKSGAQEYLQPSLILQIIRKKRATRVQAKLGSVTPPNGVTGAEYLKWLDKVTETVAAPPAAPRQEPRDQVGASQSNLAIES